MMIPRYVFMRIACLFALLLSPSAAESKRAKIDTTVWPRDGYFMLHDIKCSDKNRTQESAAICRIVKAISDGDYGVFIQLLDSGNLIFAYDYTSHDNNKTYFSQNFVNCDSILDCSLRVEDLRFFEELVKRIISVDPTNATWISPAFNSIYQLVSTFYPEDLRYPNYEYLFYKERIEKIVRIMGHGNSNESGESIYISKYAKDFPERADLQLLSLCQGYWHSRAVLGTHNKSELDAKLKDTWNYLYIVFREEGADIKYYCKR